MLGGEDKANAVEAVRRAAKQDKSVGDSPGQTSSIRGGQISMSSSHSPQSATLSAASTTFPS